MNPYLTIQQLPCVVIICNAEFWLNVPSEFLSQHLDLCERSVILCTDLGLGRRHPLVDRFESVTPVPLHLQATKVLVTYFILLVIFLRFSQGISKQLPPCRPPLKVMQF